MPLGYRIFPDHRLLFIRAHGVTTQDERMRAMRAWLREPEYQRCRDALLDITTAETTPKVAELRELVDSLLRNRTAGGPRKLAIVADKPIAFGVARVFGELVQVQPLAIEVEVFSDSNLAWSWLRPRLVPAEHQ